MITIRLKNTLTGNKEIFTTSNNAVTMYVCGITPYDYAHMGHGRCYVTFDVIYRLLQGIGYKVRYCRNFTDIDDKLLNRAEQEFGDRGKYTPFAEQYIAAYHNDMNALSCLPPTVEPRVTQVIPDIISFIEKLVEKGCAYESNQSVYFSVESAPDYGKLSKRELDELAAGARVEVSAEKRNPADFVLWKKDESAIFWDSPWGHGRPGWHIECSVMARKYLGDIIDIHGGGMDLTFPHHENEIAQSECYHDHAFVRYWLHNAFVQINQQKMSKSLGNFFTLRDVFKKYDPMVVRYLFISHHYRSPLDFSFDELENAQKAYKKLIRVLADKKLLKEIVIKGPIAQKMMQFLADDVNTPGMLGVVFEHAQELQQDSHQAAEVKAILVNICGLSLAPLPEHEAVITPEINRLIKEREAARAARDWARSDALRDQLKELGYVVQDKKL